MIGHPARKSLIVIQGAWVTPSPVEGRVIHTGSTNSTGSHAENHNGDRNGKEQAAWIAAVGDPTRLTIIRALATGEKTVAVPARACNAEVVNVSQHLGVMRDAGLVTVERDGRFMRYNRTGTTATAGAVELAHPSGINVVVPLV